MIEHLEEASDHLTLQVEVLLNWLLNARKGGSIPEGEVADLELTVQALACVERARDTIATRAEREAFTLAMFARMAETGLTHGEAIDAHYREAAGLEAKS